MVKFKQYTEDEFDSFIGDNFLEDDSLWEFIKERNVNLKFDDKKGVLTIKVQYQESDEVGETDEEDGDEDITWN